MTRCNLQLSLPQSSVRRKSSACHAATQRAMPQPSVPCRNPACRAAIQRAVPQPSLMWCSPACRAASQPAVLQASLMCCRPACRAVSQPAVLQASARTTRGRDVTRARNHGVARVPISSWSGEGQNACRQEAKIGRVRNSNKRRDFRVGFWRASFSLRRTSVRLARGFNPSPSKPQRSLAPPQSQLKKTWRNLSES